MAGSKIVDFPADKITELPFDYDEFIEKMTLQGEKDAAVCAFGMRVLQLIAGEIDRGEKSVVSISDSTGKKEYFVSFETIKNIMYHEFGEPV